MIWVVCQVQDSKCRSTTFAVIRGNGEADFLSGSCGSVVCTFQTLVLSLIPWWKLNFPIPSSLLSACVSQPTLSNSNNYYDLGNSLQIASTYICRRRFGWVLLMRWLFHVLESSISYALAVTSFLCGFRAHVEWYAPTKLGRVGTQ